MGLFDSIAAPRVSKTTSMSPAEAVAGIIFCAICADGHTADAEIKLLVSVVSRMQLFRSYPSEVMNRMFDHLGLLLQRLGFEDFINLAIASLPFELGPTVFAVAADVVLSDGEVSEGEEYILELLYKKLGMDRAQAIKIIDVMVIKNKG